MRKSLAGMLGTRSPGCPALTAVLLCVIVQLLSTPARGLAPGTDASLFRDQLREKMAHPQQHTYAKAYANAYAQLSSRRTVQLAPSIHVVVAAPARKQVAVPMKTAATHWAVPSFQHAWLAIGMPSVPRPGDPDYLARSVASFVQGLPSDDLDPFYRQVQLVVMNNQPGNHTLFYELKRELSTNSGQAARDHVTFVDNPGTILDPDPALLEPDDRRNPLDYPGSHVRNQTTHVLELLKMLQPKSTLYMFAEDDFIFCKNWLEALRWALKKAALVNPRWGALRVSFGMNGLVMRSADLPHLMDWVWTNITLKPVDLLWADYMRRHLIPHGRPLAVYRFILMEHIGQVSSFAARDSRPPWPGCYKPMSKVWSMHKDELYDVAKCPDSDIFPCKPAAPVRSGTSGLIHSIIDFQAGTSSA